MSLAWTVTTAMMFGALLIGPFIMIVIPFLFFAGASLITAAHEWAFADETCGACGRLIEREEQVGSTRLEPVHAHA